MKEGLIGGDYDFGCGFHQSVVWRLQDLPSGSFLFVRRTTNSELERTRGIRLFN